MSTERFPEPNADQIAAMMLSGQLQDFIDVTVTPENRSLPGGTTASAKGRALPMQHQMAERTFDLPIPTSEHPLHVLLWRSYRQQEPKPALEHNQKDIFRQRKNRAFRQFSLTYLGHVSMGIPTEGDRAVYTTYKVHHPDKALDGLGIIAGRTVRLDRASATLKTVRRLGVLDADGVRQLGQTLRYVTSYGEECER